MPELPEVETIKNGLKNTILQKKIISTKIYNPKLKYPIDLNLNTYLENQVLQDITRRSKYLIFHFENYDILVHLGMTGKFNFYNNYINPLKHEHLEFNFTDKTILRYEDTRRFGLVLLCKKNTWKEHKLIKNLGLEPFDENFTEEYLYESLKNKKTSIKQLLLGNKIVVGVGNIYANEALFKSKINPKEQSYKISFEKCCILRKNILDVLKDSIKKGGTTLKDFQNVDGNKGYFVNDLLVYGKENLKCINCDTKIIKIMQNGRSTFYCETCQKL